MEIKEKSRLDIHWKEAWSIVCFLVCLWKACECNQAEGKEVGHSLWVTAVLLLYWIQVATSLRDIWAWQIKILKNKCRSPEIVSRSLVIVYELQLATCTLAVYFLPGLWDSVLFTYVEMVWHMNHFSKIFFIWDL